MGYKTNLDSLRDAYNEAMGNIWGVSVKIKAKLNVGNNLFRFAPQHPNMKLLYLPVRVHTFVGGVKTNHCFCPFEAREYCPICERGQELLQSGDASADKLQPQKKYLYNVVDLGTGQENPQDIIKKVLKEGIIQLMLGIKAHKDIMQGMLYGGVGDITDLESGCTANIYREGTEWNNTTYKFYPLQAKPVPQELMPILSKPPDITSIVQYHTDEELVMMLAGQSVFFPAEGMPQQQPVRKPMAQQQPVRKPAKTNGSLNPKDWNIADGQGNTINTKINSPF